MKKSDKNGFLAILIMGAVGVAALLLTACQEGPRGYTGAPGGQGGVGPQGPTGATGPAGANGADGQPAQVAQLCPGISNYGTFVEIALRINSRLYAVYSQNGGFLTYLAPGNYSSNAVGSACNFTVTADNQITH